MIPQWCYYINNINHLLIYKSFLNSYILRFQIYQIKNEIYLIQYMCKPSQISNMILKTIMYNLMPTDIGCMADIACHSLHQFMSLVWWNTLCDSLFLNKEWKLPCNLVCFIPILFHQDLLCESSLYFFLNIDEETHNSTTSLFLLATLTCVDFQHADWWILGVGLHTAESS